MIGLDFVFQIINIAFLVAIFVLIVNIMNLIIKQLTK